MRKSMRGLPFLFLLLMAAHPPGPRGFHHHRVSTWRMGAHDGSAATDFGRTLAHGEHITAAARDRLEIKEPRRLNSFELGRGARLGVGFVGGRHVGFRLKSPF
jgi:hypothetical protein